MKYGALLLLSCVGCVGTECVLADTPVIVSGTGALSAGDEAFAMNGVAWTEPSAPTITKSVSFSIDLGQGPHVECDRVPWASLAKGAPVNVSDECVVMQDNGASARLTDATLSATSTLDAKNEGTLTLRFDAPHQAVTLVTDGIDVMDAEISIEALVANVAFTRGACASDGEKNPIGF